MKSATVRARSSGPEAASPHPLRAALMRFGFSQHGMSSHRSRGRDTRMGEDPSVGSNARMITSARVPARSALASEPMIKKDSNASSGTAGLEENSGL